MHEKVMRMNLEVSVYPPSGIPVQSTRADDILTNRVCSGEHGIIVGFIDILAALSPRSKRTSLTAADGAS